MSSKAPDSVPPPPPQSVIRPVRPELDLSKLLLGKYRVLGEVGRGGMAEVYLAVAHGLSGFNKLVVLKIIRVEIAEDADARNMFVDEARLAGRLNHSNVVHTLEVGEEMGRPILVMEHLDGQPLNAVFRRCRRDVVKLPVKIGLRVLVEILQGLHYAHMLKDFDGTPLNLVHRDVSPQNIFLTYDGQIKMLDFGIAKAAITSSETRAGMMKGKAAFMSPEQISGDPVDCRADVYSTGVVLWQLLTGRQWWKGKPQGQILLTVLKGDVPKPSAVCDDVDEDLEAICLKAMAVEPANRYQTALEMLEALEGAIDARGGATARDVGAFVAGLFEDERELLGRTLETELRSLSDSRSVRIMPGVSASQDSIDDSQGSIRSVNTVSNLLDSEGEPEANRKRRNLMFAFSVLALIAVAGIGWLALRSPASKQELKAATPAAQTAVAPVASPSSAASIAPAPLVQKCRLSIGAKPRSATIFLDDKELKGNPVEVEVSKDGKPHAVRAEAAGYETRTVEVVADRDAEFVVDLDRLRAGGHAPAPKAEKTAASERSVSPPAPTKTAAPKEDPKSARDRIKELDTSSPW